MVPHPRGVLHLNVLQLKLQEAIPLLCKSGRFWVVHSVIWPVDSIWANFLTSFAAKCVSYNTMLCKSLHWWIKYFKPLGSGAGQGHVGRKGKFILEIYIYFSQKESLALPEGKNWSGQLYALKFVAILGTQDFLCGWQIDPRQQQQSPSFGKWGPMLLGPCIAFTLLSAATLVMWPIT